MTNTPDDEFEEMVAALLKVDPEGISGKATKKKAGATPPKNAGSPGGEPTEAS